MRNARTHRHQDFRRSTPTRRPHLRLVGADFRPLEQTRHGRPRKAEPEIVPLPHQHFCGACDCEITRFDAEVYLITGRCGPCDETLSG
jgi:hypothetical protein